jgi:hypothetical protein
MAHFIFDHKINYFLYIFMNSWFIEFVTYVVKTRSDKQIFVTLYSNFYPQIYYSSPTNFVLL